MNMHARLAEEEIFVSTIVNTNYINSLIHPVYQCISTGSTAKSSSLANQLPRSQIIIPSKSGSQTTICERKRVC